MAHNSDKPLLEKMVEAKQNIENKIKDLELKEAGFKKLNGGFSFPGINVTEADSANKRLKTMKPEEIIEPLVIINIMSEYAKLLIKFSNPMLIPGKVNNGLWDKVFEIKVLSNNNGRVYTSSFTDIVNNRLLQDLNDTSKNDLLAFYPIVSNYSENFIEIDFNFVNKKDLSIDQ